MDVVVRLAIRMVVLAGVESDPAAAAARVQRALSSGRALEAFGRMIAAQGGEARILDDPSLLPAAPGRETYRAARGGYVAMLSAQDIGRASHTLGAGRAAVTDPVDHAVGVRVLVSLGEQVAENQPLVELHHRHGRGLAAALDYCRRATSVADAPPPARAKVLGEVR
jgi:pyrimidine-nucleoside phosphorylase